jgi:hypothetical protein
LSKRLTVGGKVVNLTRRPRFTPRTLSAPIADVVARTARPFNAHCVCVQVLYVNVVTFEVVSFCGLPHRRTDYEHDRMLSWRPPMVPKVVL